MSINKETSVLELVINGKQAETSINGLTNSISTAVREFRKLREADDPAKYKQSAEAINSQKNALNDMRKSISGVNKESKELQSNWRDIAKGVVGGNSITSLLQTAVAGVKQFIGESQAAYSEAEQNQAQLQAALKSTGGVAGKTQKDLNAMATSLMNLTGVDDDAITKTEALLLTFTDIKGKIFDDALPAIVDMTAALNQGNVTSETLQQTTIQVGKALNDPINGLTALKRVGVSFNEEQITMIKNMVKSGDTIGAQNLMLKELQKEFGGVAEALKATDSGGLKTFETDLGNVQEKIGRLIVGFKAWFLTATGFGNLVKSMGDTRTEAEKLNDTLNEQTKSIASLEKNALPLADRYDELKTKTKLSKDEQKELNTVMNSIADLIPSAVTKWDQFGHAIEISTGKIRDSIEAQKTLRAATFSDTIAAKEKELKEVDRLQKDFQSRLNYGKKTDYSDPKQPLTINLSDKELLTLRDRLKDLTDKSGQLNKELKVLKGENLDGPTKNLDKSTKTTSLTIGELKDSLTALRGGLDNTVKGSKEYKAILGQINSIQKQLQETDTFKNQEKATKQAKTDAENYQKRLEAVTEAGKKALRDIYIDGMDPLDQIITQITDKYDVLLQEFAGNPEMLAKLKVFRDSEVGAAGSNFQKTDNKPKIEQAKKDKEEELKAASTMSDAFYQIEKNKLGQQYVDGLLSKEDYDKKTEILEYERVTALIEINKQYGVSTAELETQLTNLKISEKDREAANAIKKEKEKNDFAIQMAQEASNAIFSIIGQNQQAQSQATIANIEKQRTAELANKELSEKQKKSINDKYDAQVRAEKKRAWAAEQRAAIAQAVISGALAVLKVTQQTGIIAPFIIPGIIAGTAAQIAVIASQKPPQFAKGGFIPDGPSHANGGMKVLDAKGNPVAEIEGGEPILSRETYRNNQQTIDALLYSSQRLNGARVNLNSTAALSAERYFRSGGVIMPPEFKQNISNNTNFDMASTNQLLMQLIDKVQNQEVSLNLRMLEEAQQRRVNTKNAASA